MRVRITVLTGVSDIDGGVAFVRDHVVPELQQQNGFRGLDAAGDRSAGVVTVLSAWESQADLEASESSADKARGDAIRLLGGQATVHRYEQAIGEVAETAAGAKLHIRHFKIDPSRTDDNLAFFRRNVLPEIKAAPGFLALRQLIDRSTGEGRVGTVWADYEALEASLARSEQRRADATSRGVEFGEERVLEVLFTT